MTINLNLCESIDRDFPSKAALVLNTKQFHRERRAVAMLQAEMDLERVRQLKAARMTERVKAAFEEAAV